MSSEPRSGGPAVETTEILDSDAAGRLVVRGGALRFVGYAASTALSLGGVALVTRQLGVVDYGRYQTIISLITIVGAVTDAGMATLGVREYAQGNDRNALMRSLLGLRLALTALGVLIATVIAAAAGYGGGLVLGTLLAGGGLVLTVLQTTLSIPLGATLRNGALAGIDLLRQTLTVVGFAVLTLAGAGVVAFLAVPVPVGVAVVATVAVLVRRAIPLRPTVDVHEWATLLRAAVAFAAATAVGSIYTYTAQVLTSIVASHEEAGLFAAAFRTFIVVASVAGLLVTVAFPVLARAAREDDARLAYGMQRVFETSAILGIAASLVTVVGAPGVIAVMAGPDYEGAVGPLRITALTMLASFVLAPWGFGLLSLHRHRALLVANAVALVVSLVAVGLLASAHGAAGAAAGTVAGEFALAAGYLVGLMRGRPELRPQLGRPLRAVVAALPGLALLAAPIPSLIAAVLALGVYAGMLMLLRAVPDEVLDLLPQRQ